MFRWQSPRPEKKKPRRGTGLLRFLWGNSDGEGKTLHTTRHTTSRCCRARHSCRIVDWGGGGRASWLLSHGGTCFACRGATPEICHASDGKMTNRIARRLSGELAIARGESLAEAGLFFFRDCSIRLRFRRSRGGLIPPGALVTDYRSSGAAETVSSGDSA